MELVSLNLHFVPDAVDRFDTYCGAVLHLQFSFPKRVLEVNLLHRPDLAVSPLLASRAPKHRRHQKRCRRLLQIGNQFCAEEAAIDRKNARLQTPIAPSAAVA